VFNEPNSQRFWVTSLNDGTAIDPLDFASAEGNPDDVVSLMVDHREVWLFGSNTVEVWYNAGLADFPLARIEGAFMETGCLAPYSVAKLDNSVFWLGSDARGNGIVYRNQGYNAQRVSTHAIEWQIQQYNVLNDAIGYSYQQDGHSFYVLTFPTANATWVFDVSTGAWHERAFWDGVRFRRHRSNCQANFVGQVVVGDWEDGRIYAFDPEVYRDGNNAQRWLRSWRALPTGQNNLKRTAHHMLQLDCESGATSFFDTSQASINWIAFSTGILQYTAAQQPGSSIMGEKFNGRLLGDVDNTGSVVLADALAVLAYSVGNPVSDAIRNYLQITATEILFSDPAKYNAYISGTVNVGTSRVMLRWSDDGGHTWSNEHWASMGKLGEYGKRVIWRRLGMTTKLRDRVYEISGTDPVKIAIMGAELSATPTSA
jgi:hypothetical protein